MKKGIFLWDVMGPCFYEPPNWIILFQIQFSDTELLNLGKCKLLPSNESFWPCSLSLRMGFWSSQKFLENFMTDFILH